MSVVESSAKGFHSPLKLQSYQRDSDDASIRSQSTTNNDHTRNNIARRLFDNDRLDRKLQRHHITCMFIESMITVA